MPRFRGLPGMLPRCGVAGDAPDGAEGHRRALVPVPGELRSVPLLEALDDATLTAAAAILRLSRFRRGQRLLSGTDGRRSLVLVIAGRLRVSSVGLNGREVTLHRFCAGSVAGLRNLLPEERLPSALETVAETDGSLAKAYVGDVLDAMTRHPALGRALLGEAARQLRDAEEFARRMVSSPVEARVAAALLEHVPPEAAVAVAREDLACRAAASRESVSRALRQLALRGLIRVHGRAVVLADEAGLRAFASPDGAAPCYGRGSLADGGCGDGYPVSSEGSAGGASRRRSGEPDLDS